jgi:acetylglutamate/LysW-gamma-L-alpha-aminoadipate kinase
VRDNLGGKVTAVNTQLLLLLLGSGFVPVVSPPALDATGTALNVDADRAAAAVARALGASSLIFLTAARGVLRVDGEEQSRLDVCRIPSAGPPPSYAGAGMALKLVGAREALRGGVAEVIIADGRVEDPLRRALQGDGTRVELEEAPNSAGAREHQKDVHAT